MKLFVFYRKNKEDGKVKKYLSWGFHELASSIRQEGFPIWILNNKGEVLKTTYTTKSAGNTEISREAKYIVKYYRTNSGYVHYTIFEIPEKNFGELKVVDSVQEVQEVVNLKIPDGVKEFVINKIMEVS